MKQLSYSFVPLLGLLSALLPTAAFGQSCDAFFSFDGNLADTGGGAYHGTMIGESGTTRTPVFVEGQSGQALQLDGSSAMQTFIDLHYDACPQVTIAAWVNFDSEVPRSQQFIFSTGSGSGPGMRRSSNNLILNGTGNGLNQKNAISGNGGWMHVAGVYNYTTNSYSLYWRNRHIDGTLSKNLNEPEPAFWVGARNGDLGSPASGITIDELQIIGRALSDAEVRQLQFGAPEVSSAPEPASPQPAPTSTVASSAGKQDSMHSDATISTSATRPISSDSDDGNNQTAGANQTFGNASTLSTGGLDQVKAARAENAPLPTGYNSEEEGVAAAAAADKRRADEAYQEALYREQNELEQHKRDAAEDPVGATGYWLRYTNDLLVYTDVSGSAGDYSERIVFTEHQEQLNNKGQELLHWIRTREDNDKPCKIYVDSALAAYTYSQNMSAGRLREGPSVTINMDVCDQGLPKIGFGVFREVSKPIGEFMPVTAIQTCHSANSKRVKGIRAQTRNITFPDGTPSANYKTVVMDEKSNCSTWEPMESCPASTFAVGLTLYFMDGSALSPKDFLSGIALVCSSIELEKG